jgi:hypothetical protein
MTIYEYVAFSGVFIFIFGYMISIFTLIKSIEEFIKTQPKFVYEVEIDNSQGHRKIISSGLPFPEYHKAKNINENMKNPIFYPKTGDNASAIGTPYIQEISGENNTKFKSGGLAKLRTNGDRINSSIEFYISNNGMFKSKKDLMTFIFKEASPNSLHLKDVAEIFVFLKQNNLLKKTFYSTIHSFDLKDIKFMKYIYTYIYWYMKSSKKIEATGVSQWRYKS